MKPEDVPPEWVRLSHKAYMAAPGSHMRGMRAALAAVIPIIEAKEREACAGEADAEASVEGIAQRIAAAIRARGGA